MNRYDDHPPMSRYVFTRHDEASHTLEQACLELDASSGEFLFTERRAYADWGDRIEETTERRGAFTRRELEVVCVSSSSLTTRRSADHEMGTSERSESASAEVETLTFRVATDGGLVCPSALALARAASGEAMHPSTAALRTLFPEA